MLPSRWGALTLVGQIAQSKGDDLGKSTGYGLEAWYDLSKRTRTYHLLRFGQEEMLNDERNTAFGHWRAPLLLI